MKKRWENSKKAITLGVAGVLLAVSLIVLVDGVIFNKDVTANNNTEAELEVVDKEDNKEEVVINKPVVEKEDKKEGNKDKKEIKKVEKTNTNTNTNTKANTKTNTNNVVKNTKTNTTTKKPIKKPNKPVVKPITYPKNNKTNKIVKTIIRYNISDNDYNKAVNLLNDYLPNSILDYIVDKGITIKICKDVNKTYKQDTGEEYEPLSGIYNYTLKRAYVKSADLDTTLFHELGHGFDFDGYKIKSETKEFLEIYKLERKKLYSTNSFLDNYYRSDVGEYFAQSFYLYLRNKTTLKTKAPKTYEYFKNLIK